MASKSIDIKIASSFNADGVLEANKGLAKLAQDVKGVNDEMRKATMRAEMAVNSYAENADKAVKAMGGGYKTLEQQLAELVKEHESVGTKAVNAGTAATKSALGLEMAMGLVRGSTEQTAKAFALLSQKVPMLGKVGVASMGAWAAAIAGVYKLGESLVGLFKEVFNLNGVSKDITEASAAMLDLNNAANDFKVAMDEARDTSKRQLKVFEEEADALNKVTKAQIELNRARDLSNAKTDDERSAINAQYDSASAAADEENAALKREAKRNELLKEQSRLRAEIREAEKTRENAKQYFGKGMGFEDSALDAQDKIDSNEKLIEQNRHNLDMLDKEEEAAEILIEARKQKEINAANEAAQKKADEEAKIDAKAEEDRIKAEKEAAKKAEAERIKSVEAEKKAREKMEADLHKQRLDNLNAEIKAQETKAASTEAIAQAAQTEFDKAFAMYRSEDKGAAAIAEERDYAADYKQLQKDAARYGGKWRIDELSALMAAGDTKGQAAKLEEWRKSSSFTPEVESMVRAAAADNTRTTAEDELRQINANTKDLSDKLDELLKIKG